MGNTFSLSTRRLLIRDLLWKDLEFIHSLHSDPKVQEYATLSIPESLDESKDYLQRYVEQQNDTPRKEYGLCISLINGVPIGLIGLKCSLDKFEMAELWFKLYPGYWGKGYVTEATSGMLEFGFKQLFLHRLVAGVATENLASINILEKVGMKREGLGRKILPIRGEWKDNFHYAILREEFQS